MLPFKFISYICTERTIINKLLLLYENNSTLNDGADAASGGERR